MTSVTSKEKIKVFFSIYGLDGGGAERVIVNLVNHIDRDRFEPVLVLLYEGGQYIRDILPDVPVIELYRTLTSGTRDAEGGLFPRGRKGLRGAVGECFWAFRKSTFLPGPVEAAKIWMFTRHYTRRLEPAFAGLCARERPDAHISHLLLANTLALNAGAGNGIFTAVCVHNTPTDYQARAEYNWSPLERADAVLTVSHAIGRIFAAKHPEAKIRVIHNPHDIRHIQEASREAVEDPWFEEKPMPIVAGIGRLCSQKHFAVLVEAVSAINRQGRTAVRLALFGEGPERGRLARLIRKRGQQDRIRLMGWVANPFRYLARCDVLALTSRWEGLPNVLIEAMACGVPVVSVNCESGPEEILDRGACGLLVEPGDRDGLERAIEGLVRDPRKAAALRARGTERARDFDVSAILPQYENLILDGVRRKRMKA